MKNYWYALQVRSGFEMVLVAEIDAKLGDKGEAFCPVYQLNKKVSRHSRKVEPVTVPLFRKYLFVSFKNDLANGHGKIINLRGVEGFVRVDGEPLPIQSKVIVKIKSECDLGAYNDKGLSGVVQKGDRVEIVADNKHSFNGQVGEFQGLVGNHSAIIELTLFGRSSRVEISTALLEKIL